MRLPIPRATLSVLKASSRCAPRPGFLPSQARGLSVTASRRSEDNQWSTPLAETLARAIKTTGPVPLASYMRMCLTGDLGGYYTGAIEVEKGRDHFGVKGDFITSPEISQVFGELIGIWFVAEWLSQGRPKSGVELIEVGPGRGTLMADVLRTMSHFKEMAAAVDAIYMVEASAGLRVAQKNLLCGEEAPMTESKTGWHSISKYGDFPVVWTQTIKAVPQNPNKMPLIVAHEFFDALPIHTFQVVNASPNKTPSSTSPSSTLPPSQDTSKPTTQWREMLVSPTPPGSTHASLGTPQSQSHDTPVPDFQLTLSNAATRHSLYLPESSPRYRALKTVPDAVIEICPDASLYAADFATRIGGSAQCPKKSPSGAALILDYGPGDGTVPMNSLRGISKHRRVSPFAEPGLTDLSADVDFAAIVAAALQASQGVEVHGPVEQGLFLEAMGIRERAKALIQRLEKRGDHGKAYDVQRAWDRLVDRSSGGMGKIYKALAIVPENDGLRPPVGFGGDLGS